MANIKHLCIVLFVPVTWILQVTGTEVAVTSGKQLTAAPVKLSTPAAWNCGCSTADRSSSQAVNTSSFKLWLLYSWLQLQPSCQHQQLGTVAALQLTAAPAKLSTRAVGSCGCSRLHISSLKLRPSCRQLEPPFADAYSLWSLVHDKLKSSIVVCKIIGSVKNTTQS